MFGGLKTKPTLVPAPGHWEEARPHRRIRTKPIFAVDFRRNRLQTKKPVQPGAPKGALSGRKRSQFWDRPNGALEVKVPVASQAKNEANLGTRMGDRR